MLCFNRQRSYLCAGDVLGLEQLSFYEYRDNRQCIIKQEVLDEFVGDVDES